MPRYKLIEETESLIIYQHNAIYIWLSIAVVILAVIGYVSGVKVLQIAALAFVAFHFISKFFDKEKITKKIREAEKRDLTKISGNPLSFSNPMRVEIEKKHNK